MITIEIPALACSANAAWRTFKGRVITSVEYKNWLVLAKHYIPKNIPDLSLCTLSVEISLHSNWFTQKGDIRKKDADNYVKTTLDSVFKHLGVDDSHIFSLNVTKVQAVTEKTVIAIFDVGKS